jgi:lipid-A-disaccharide synthase
MLVVYKVSSHTYYLGRLLVRHMQFFSLVNLIAERLVVTELLQDEVSPGKIEAELARLLFDDRARHEMQTALAEVRGKLGYSGASLRAASLALNLLGQKK